MEICKNNFSSKKGKQAKIENYRPHSSSKLRTVQLTPTNPLQISAGEGAPQIPFAVVFTPSTPVLPAGISARWRYLYKLLFTHLRRLRVLCLSFKRDLNLGLSRITVFEDCKATTQPPLLVLVQQFNPLNFSNEMVSYWGKFWYLKNEDCKWKLN